MRCESRRAHATKNRCFGKPSDADYGVGYGVTLYSNGFINLVFIRGDAVEVRLRRPMRVRTILPRVSCNLLAASLEDPEAFLEALAKAGVPTARSE